MGATRTAVSAQARLLCAQQHANLSHARALTSMDAPCCHTCTRCLCAWGAALAALMAQPLVPSVLNKQCMQHATCNTTNPQGNLSTCPQAAGSGVRLVLDQALPELDDFVAAAFVKQARAPGALLELEVRLPCTMHARSLLDEGGGACGQHWRARSRHARALLYAWVLGVLLHAAGCLTPLPRPQRPFDPSC